MDGLLHDLTGVSCIEKGAIYFIEKLTEQSLFWDAELDSALPPAII